MESRTKTKQSVRRVYSRGPTRRDKIWVRQGQTSLEEPYQARRYSDKAKSAGYSVGCYIVRYSGCYSVDEYGEKGASVSVGAAWESGWV